MEEFRQPNEIQNFAHRELTHTTERDTLLKQKRTDYVEDSMNVLDVIKANLLTSVIQVGDQMV